MLICSGEITGTKIKQLREGLDLPVIGSTLYTTAND